MAEEIKNEFKECEQEKLVTEVMKNNEPLNQHLMRKKTDEFKEQEEVLLVSGMEKVTVHDGRHHDVKIHPHHQDAEEEGTIYSGDEEEEVVGENGEIIKRKKKKGLKEQIKEEVHGCEKLKEQCGAEEEEEMKQAATAVIVDEKMVTAVTGGDKDDNTVHVEKVEDAVKLEALQDLQEEQGEKKSFLGKIMENLPGGGNKKAGEEEMVSGEDGKEKKGILGKIMEKLPGYGNKGSTEDHGDQQIKDCGSKSCTEEHNEIKQQQGCELKSDH